MSSPEMINDANMPDHRLLDEIVKRITKTVDARRIILFGSAARGQMGPDSDLDLLVVVSDGVHRRKTAQIIFKALSGLGVSKDIIVVTESDIRDFSANPSLVIAPAISHGRELYNVAA